MRINFHTNLDKFKTRLGSQDMEFKPSVGDLVVVKDCELEVVSVKYELTRSSMIDVELWIPKSRIPHLDNKVIFDMYY